MNHLFTLYPSMSHSLRSNGRKQALERKHTASAACFEKKKFKNVHAFFRKFEKVNVFFGNFCGRRYILQIIATLLMRRRNYFGNNCYQ
jgi:hypothetical protein